MSRGRSVTLLDSIVLRALCLQQQLILSRPALAKAHDVDGGHPEDRTLSLTDAATYA